jgi:pyrroline-5-carboxylate reductase
LLEASQTEPAELRRQVTSPGGTTEAALKVLMGEGGFGDLLDKAVKAAVTRSKELAG